MLYELIAATFFGMAIWIPIYKYYISRLVGDHVVARVENREIDLAHLLEVGGVFDELADKVITKFKQNTSIFSMFSLLRSSLSEPFPFKTLLPKSKMTPKRFSRTDHLQLNGPKRAKKLH